MTELIIPSDDRRRQYVAVAGQTIFPYSFPIFFDVDLSVWRTDTEGVTTQLVLSTDFTVTGVGDQNGGDVILVVPAVDGEIITIQGVTVVDRVVDYQQAGDYFAKEVNFDYDRIITMIQERKRELERSLRLKPEDPSVNLQLPVKDVRANNYLFFDENGNPIAVQNIDTTEIPVSTYIQTLLLALDAVEARLILGAQEDVISTEGDIVIGDGAGAAARLAIGAADTFLKSDGTTASWQSLPVATTEILGLIEIATQAEADALADSTRAITPATIPIATVSQQGISAFASQAEVDAGTIINKGVTPATLASATTVSGRDLLYDITFTGTVSVADFTFDNTKYSEIMIDYVIPPFSHPDPSEIFLLLSNDNGTSFVPNGNYRSNVIKGTSSLVVEPYTSAPSLKVGRTGLLGEDLYGHTLSGRLFRINDINDTTRIQFASIGSRYYAIGNGIISYDGLVSTPSTFAANAIRLTAVGILFLGHLKIWGIK